MPMFYIVGLGNPGEEYRGSRHNVGREIVENFSEKFGFADFKFDKKNNSLISEGKVGKEKVSAILPETFMNKSGNALKKTITSAKKAKNLVVIHDDLDMPVGRAKITFGKGDGGHKGINSIAKVIGTKDFIRIKVGISGVTPAGKIKKPKGEEAVVKHVLGKFSPKEQEEIKKISKRIVGALEDIIVQDYLRAMNDFN